MSKFKSTLILVSITMVWGSSFILMKIGASEISPFAFLTLRFLLSAIILLVVFHRRLKNTNLKMLRHSAIVGFCLAACITTQIFGMKYTSASNTAFITSLGVVVVPILSAIILKKAPNKSNLLGIIFAICGLVLITGIYDDFKMNIGDLITLSGVVFVALHIILTDKYASQHDDTILLGVYQIVFVAIFAGICWLVEDPKMFFKVDYNMPILISVGLTAVFSTAYAFVMQTVVQKHASPTKVAIIFTLEPIFAQIYALFIPDASGNFEQLTLVRTIGCLLIVGGTIVSEIDIFKKREKVF